MTDDWDERYRERERIWSGRVNGALAGEVRGLFAGRALDVGCGEGADALWLATRAWTVTGIDVSEVAIARAREAGRDAALDVEWIVGDVATAGLTGFDLVAAMYPALPRGAGEPAIGALLDAVAPGGTLLVVGHAPLDREWSLARGFDIDAFVQPGDVRALLPVRWTVLADEVRPRVDPVHEGSPHTHDHVLRAVRD